MKIAVACDHRGFPLKAKAIEFIQKAGLGVLYLGTHSASPVDYPGYAQAVREAIQHEKGDQAVLLCGSGCRRVYGG